MTRRPVTRIYQATPRNLTLLAGKLQQGELVAVPTETVYGLAANALDEAACARIFKAKGRPRTDPLIIHIHSLSQLAEIAHANPTALKLAKKFWPGPLTLILPKTAQVPGIVTAGGDNVAVRMPRHALFRRLLKQCGLPLAAPSANPFGYVSPTTAQHVKEGLFGKIRYILDGGQSNIGLESTIVDARNERQLRVLRPGAISAGDLSQVTGHNVTDFKHAESSVKATQLAPGQLKQHYSPRAKVVLHKQITADIMANCDRHHAALFFAKPTQSSGNHCYWLTTRGSQTEAAKSLFAKLRALDQQGYRIIHAELAPEGAMATAINDRLRRAAAKG